MHVAYCCNECDVMKGVDKLKLEMEPEIVKTFLCFHSKAASFLIPSWQEIWNVEIPNAVSAFQPNFNQELNYFEYQKRETGKTLLSGVWVDNSQHLIVTVTKRQSVPICSTCDSVTCPHYKAFESRQKVKNRPVPNFVSRMDPPPSLNGSLLNDIEPPVSMTIDGDLIDPVDEDIIDPVIGEEDLESRHYLDLPALPVYHKMYGYNFSKILYPISRCASQQETWVKRMRNIMDLPEKFVPIWAETKVCQHGYVFDENDQNLILESKTILIYDSIGEQVFNVKNYVRKSLHSCQCTQRFDGHSQLLWNLGRGRFINYTLLNSYIHIWKNDGLPIYALHKSIIEMCLSSGITSTLSYNDLHRSICGFFVNLSFDDKVAFQCPKHGSSPVWINTDGKCTGPLKKHVGDLQELDRHPEDQQVLNQSTKFKNRVFLPVFAERSAVCELVTDKITPVEFLQKDIESENGILIVDLVTHLADEWPENLPKQYTRFLECISKATSVRGLLQVSSNTPLEHLHSYCEGTLNLRDSEHIAKLREVIIELPAFWPILDDICTLENTAYLPDVVNEIVLKLLQIRSQMFATATHRDETAYFDWTGGEHPTMCYPNMKLFRYPKKVRVNAKKDPDLCKKAFQSHSDFTAGIFSMGCAYEYNTTLGKKYTIGKI